MPKHWVHLTAGLRRSNCRRIRFAFGEGCAVLILLRYITFDEWKEEISPCGRNDGRFARKKEGGETAAKPPPHHPPYHQWHGVISTAGRNLQNYKNDNLNGAALNAVKCTRIRAKFGGYIYLLRGSDWKYLIQDLPGL